MQSPFRILVFLFYVAVMCGLVMLFSPGQLHLPGGLTIKVFTWADILPPKTEQADLTAVMALASLLDSLESSRPAAAPAADHLPRRRPDAVFTGPAETPIVFPGNNPAAFRNVFPALRALETTGSGKVRIMHYGDSQLEADRVTSFFRERMQEAFGGCGWGLLPLTGHSTVRLDVEISAAKNWRRCQPDKLGQRAENHSGPYGLPNGYYQVLNYREPGPDGQQPFTSAWAEINVTRFAKARQARATHCELYFLNPGEDGLRLEYRTGAEGVLTEMRLTETPNGPASARFSLPAGFSSLHLNFTTRGGLALYGLSLGCPDGVQVDNVAMRGSSALEFAALDAETLAVQAQKTGVKLLVLQFGVNIVPSMLESYAYYQKAFARQLRFLKTAMPGTDILVVGVSDMSRKHGGQFESYPNLGLVRDAQREAALAEGCAYWDLFTAMGGQHSMAGWVAADPPLAGADHTHFTRKGADLVGEMLFKAFFQAYTAYENY